MSNTPDIEPLGAFVWQERTRQLNEQFHLSDECGDLESAVRRLYHHILLAPRPLRPLIGCAISEQEFERHLEVGAIDAAAMALVGNDIDLVLQKSSNPTIYQAVAKIAADCQTEPMAHRHPAGAIVAALLDCLCQICDRLDHLINSDGQMLSHQDQHRPQFGQRPGTKLH